MTDAVSIISKNPNYGIDIYTYPFDHDTHALIAPYDIFLSPDEILEDLPERMSYQDIEALRKVSNEDVILGHHSLGLWIRNSYGLWFDENPFTGVDNHPDDVSFDIIQKYHAILNNDDPYTRAMSII